MINLSQIRQTKIVATLGPASSESETIEKMIRAGMDCARFNFSHGDHLEHKKRLDAFYTACGNTKKPVALMLDTKGPEIRIKQFKNKSVYINEGQYFSLCCYDVTGDENKVSVTYPDLYKEVNIATVILIDDGLMSFVVDSINGQDIVCIAQNTGKLSDNKSINIPDTNIKLPGLTKRDIDDITFGVKNGFDFIAASFIRNAEDVNNIRALLNELDASDVKIISKIENRQGVNNIDSIIAASDGIMVGRGDLGVEIPAENVPAVQKMIIRKCNAYGIPVITATQMLESMSVNPRPTRAEVGDVANASYDGTDAVMLSAETAAGVYPVESVATMARILVAAEATFKDNASYKKGYLGEINIINTIAYAALSSTESLKASAIITPTSSGNTARAIAKFRPLTAQLAVTNNKRVYRQLCLVWGVIPLYIEEWRTLNAGVKHALNFALKYGILEKEDIIVVTAGVPLGFSGGTNTLKIDHVKDYYEV